MANPFSWADKKKSTEEEIQRQNEENLRNVSQKTFRDLLLKGLPIKELFEILTQEPELLEFCGNLQVSSGHSSTPTSKVSNPESKFGNVVVGKTQKKRLVFNIYDGMRLAERAVYVLISMYRRFKHTKNISVAEITTHIVNDDAQNASRFFMNLGLESSTKAAVNAHINELVEQRLLEARPIKEGGTRCNFSISEKGERLVLSVQESFKLIDPQDAFKAPENVVQKSSPILFEEEIPNLPEEDSSQEDNSDRLPGETPEDFSNEV